MLTVHSVRVLEVETVLIAELGSTSKDHTTALLALEQRRKFGADSEYIRDLYIGFG